MFDIAQQVCLFSYGQTGAGKTHTMQGNASTEGRGITPRALEQVCQPEVSLRTDNAHYCTIRSLAPENHAPGTQLICEHVFADPGGCGSSPRPGLAL
jgi:hypothetical protein